MDKNIEIIWLEDEPETISIIKHILESKYSCKIKVCQSFASFSTEVELFKDSPNHLIIIDIKMIFTSEMKFRCFGKNQKNITSSNNGFDYFDYCIKDNFTQAQIVFFSQKSKEEAEQDAKKYQITRGVIVSKESTTDLIDLIKEIL